MIHPSIIPSNATWAGILGSLNSHLHSKNFASHVRGTSGSTVKSNQPTESKGTGSKNGESKEHQQFDE
jgi:hypothetical protein